MRTFPCLSKIPHLLLTEYKVILFGDAVKRWIKYEEIILKYINLINLKKRKTLSNIPELWLKQSYKQKLWQSQQWGISNLSISYRWRSFSTLQKVESEQCFVWPCEHTTVQYWTSSSDCCILPVTWLKIIFLYFPFGFKENELGSLLIYLPMMDNDAEEVAPPHHLC